METITYPIISLRLILPFVVLLLASGLSFAQRGGFRFTPPAGMSPRTAAAITRSLTYDYSATPAPGRAKSTAAERLVGIATYDFSGGAGQLVDSEQVYYLSATRGSAFDFPTLDYDLSNYEADYPVAVSGAGYVQYDTVRRFDPPGSANYTATASRTYDASGRISVFDQPDPINAYRNYFRYNSAGKLTTTTTMATDPNTGFFDSSIREFYAYNSSGFLIRDSAEGWDPSTMTWSPAYTLVYTVNSAGYPTQTVVRAFFSGLTLTVARIDAIYNAANQQVLNVTRRLTSFPGTLSNYSKDSMGYTGSQLTFRSSYLWDTTSSAWQLSGQERRHLNGLSLPDSVWTRNDTGSTSVVWDTTVTKLQYNANSNPMVKVIFAANGTSRVFASRYYYGPFVGVGVKPVVAEGLRIYPNPARGVLYVDGITGGQYTVSSINGATLATGAMPAAGMPVYLPAMPAGQYLITVVDGAGILRGARFSVE